MNSADRRATVALWSIQGVGPVTLREIEKRFGSLGELLERKLSAWAPLVAWRGDAFERVMELETLALAADRVERRCREMGAQILFSSDKGFPSRLESLRDKPPLLFSFGPGAAAPARRRLAIVGTRSIDAGSAMRVTDVAAEAAGCGLGIVSGAARGIDQAAHRGALSQKGETWAFLGSALDEIDALQQPICNAILDSGRRLVNFFRCTGCRP